MRPNERSLMSPVAMLCIAPIALLRARATLSEADRLALRVAITTVALTNVITTAHAATEPVVVCVRGDRYDVDPDPRVVTALQESRSFPVRPMSACLQEPLRPGSRGISFVVDTVTGKRGIWVGAFDLTAAPVTLAIAA
jgi:hypothetical protein